MVCVTFHLWSCFWYHCCPCKTDVASLALISSCLFWAQSRTDWGGQSPKFWGHATHRQEGGQGRRDLLMWAYLNLAHHCHQCLQSQTSKHRHSHWSGDYLWSFLFTSSTSESSLRIPTFWLPVLNHLHLHQLLKTFSVSSSSHAGFVGMKWGEAWVWKKWRGIKLSERRDNQLQIRADTHITNNAQTTPYFRDADAFEAFAAVWKSFSV